MNIYTIFMLYNLPFSSIYQVSSILGMVKNSQFRSIGSQLVLRDAMLIVAMDRLLNKSGSWMILQV